MNTPFALSVREANVSKGERRSCFDTPRPFDRLRRAALSTNAFL